MTSHALLENARDLQQAQTRLQAVIPSLRRVVSATVVRHKPGRRALIEYRLDTPTGPLTLLGKLRFKGTDWASYRLQQTLWNQGFAADSPDGISVPEPMGVIPDWHLWLQRKVPGVPATELLPTPAGVPLASCIATLAHKLHQTPISTPKTHTLADELHILHERLPLVAQQHPQWEARIAQILNTSDTLTQNSPLHLPPSPHLPLHSSTHPPCRALTLIHRDFYADQVLVDRNRLWLVDLDLCCQGDPALDIGNFIAHITEQSLRQMGNPAAMAEREAALREAFIEAQLSSIRRSDSGTQPLDPDVRAGVQANPLRWAIELYTALTLVRHIHISTGIAARRPYTEAILTLCETRIRDLLTAPR